MAFFDSWTLFFRPYTLTMIAGAVLSIVGVVATARRQLFMAVAVAQTSLMGYAFMAFLFGSQIQGVPDSVLRDVLVIGIAIAAAIFTMRGGLEGQSAAEAPLDGDERTAWIYVTAGTLAVLFLARPGGHGAGSAPAGLFSGRRDMDRFGQLFGPAFRDDSRHDPVNPAPYSIVV